MAEQPSSKELKSSLEFTKTNADHFGQQMTNSLGSIPFLVGCVLFFIAWMGWNVLGGHPFDAAPFPILETAVSVFAIILSVTVLINQNRQGKMDKVRQQVEFEVNVRAEEEITKVLNMLHDIQNKMGIANSVDKELEQMKENIDVNEIHKNVDPDEAN
jgi:uncharacterized membrane protein